MRLTLLLLTTALSVFASVDVDKKFSQIPESVFDGFKHLNAREFVKELQFGPKGKRLPYGLVITLCRYSYCHGEDKTDCSDSCADAAPKFDYKVIGERLEKLDARKQPDANQAVCEKECAIECGKSDCSKECPRFCGIHFSYPNRKEYEAEFYEFVIRINKIKVF